MKIRIEVKKFIVISVLLQSIFGYKAVAQINSTTTTTPDVNQQVNSQRTATIPESPAVTVGTTPPPAPTTQTTTPLPQPTQTTTQTTPPLPISTTSQNTKIKPAVIKDSTSFPAPKDPLVADAPMSEFNNINYFIDEALKNSPDIGESTANRVESSKLVTQSYLSVLPVITARAGTGRQYYDTPANDQKTYNAEELSANLHQNIFGEGRISDVKINKSVLNSKIYELEQVRNLIVLSTIESYFNVLRYEAIAKIQQGSFDYHNDTLGKTKARLDAGLMRVSDLYLVEARTANSRASLSDTKSQLAKSKNLLYRYSGVRVEGQLQDFDMPGDVPRNFDEAWEIASQSSPIIKAKYHETKTGEFVRKKELIKLYPSISADLSAQKNHDANGIEGDEENLSAMLNLTYSFNFGSQAYAASAAKSRAQSIKYSYEKSKSDVYQSLSSLYSGYDEINNKVEILKLNSDFLTQTVGKNQQEYDAGFRSLLDLLNTRNELFSSQIQYINATYDRKILAYSILANTGQLLTHFQR